MISKILKNPQIISSKIAYDGWFKVREDILILPRTKLKQKYSVLESVDSIMVLPITDDNKLVVCSEYRHPVKKWVYNFPSGRINNGEEPEFAAARELQEETGYKANKLERVCEGYLWPGVSDIKIYCFVAKNLKKVKQKQDSDEDIQIIEIPYEQLLQESLTGKQTNMQLNYLMMIYELLKNK